MWWVWLLLPFLFGLSNQSEGAISARSRWVLPKPTQYTFGSRPSERTAPVIVGDIVYVATLRGEVFAIHRLKGTILWRKKMAAPVQGAFSYGRSKLFVGDLEGNLTALYARNGKVAWKAKVGAQWLTPPVQSGARLFAINSAGELYVYSERRGTELWQYARRGDEKITVRGSSTPVVFGAEVYQGFADGSFVALSVKTGAVRWVKALGRRSRFYDVDATPYVGAKHIIVGTYDGSLYSLDRLTGNIQWRFPVGSYGGIRVWNRKVYFSGLDRHVYALDFLSGRQLWKTPYKKGVGMTPIIVQNHLLVPTSSDPLLLLDLETGKVNWKGALGVGTMAAAAGHTDGWFYCLSNYGNFFAFQLDEVSSGKKRFKTIKTPSALHRNFVKQRSHHQAS